MKKKGPRVEVYGFVAWITSFVVFGISLFELKKNSLILKNFKGIYLIWAYFPDNFLIRIGITWYPNK